LKKPITKIGLVEWLKAKTPSSSLASQKNKNKTKQKSSMKIFNKSSSFSPRKV
jgi:hypothetical protein